MGGGGGVKDTTGPNDPIVGTRAHVPYTGGVQVGTVTGVHHGKSGVVWLQYPNDTTLYESGATPLLRLRRGSQRTPPRGAQEDPQTPPNKAPADPEPKANPPTNPEENKKTAPEENKKPGPEAYPSTNPTPALWDPKEGSQEV